MLRCILVGMDRKKQTTPNSTVLPITDWLIPMFWGILGLVIIFLFALAAVLLAKSGVLSARSLTDSQAKSLWAFLGVAFGAVVTLIGALLTEQHNRRTDTLAREAENRLRIDTVAKVLELVTIESSYAPRARVAGAIATLMELGGGSVGLRILGELWAADAVDSDTAVWLIDRILQDSTSLEEEKELAAAVLFKEASRLVPARDDSDQNWRNTPRTIDDSWPTTALSSDARYSLLLAIVRMLQAREIGFWRADVPPLKTLVKALDDPDWNWFAACVLDTLRDSGALIKLRFSVDDELAKRIQMRVNYALLYPWAKDILEELRSWANN